MSKQVIAFLNDALQSGKSAALVTLTESGNDTPGLTGGMMAVLTDGTIHGTVGGGSVENAIIQKCVDALKSGESSSFSFEYSLTSNGELGMVCGGDVRGFAKILRPDNRLIIFGGGHVGQKIYEVGLSCGFAVTVVEDRDSLASNFAEADFRVSDDFASAAAELDIDARCFIVVVTRGHSYDYAVVRALAEKGMAYLGMIGSRNKVAATFSRLREDIIPQECIDRIYAPIGLNIDDGSPGEIAVSVLAEILQVKNGGELRHCKNRT